jgi:hypothetical protein
LVASRQCSSSCNMPRLPAHFISRNDVGRLGDGAAYSCWLSAYDTLAAHLPPPANGPATLGASAMMVAIVSSTRIKVTPDHRLSDGQQPIRAKPLGFYSFSSRAQSRFGERSSNTAFSPITENLCKTIVCAIGYRMAQVNSRRRKRPERDEIRGSWPSRVVDSHGQNSANSRGYSRCPKGREREPAG